MEKRNDDELEIDLVKLFGALWQRIWTIVLVAAICAGVALTGSLLLVSPEYKAQARIYLMYNNSRNFSLGDKEGSITEEGMYMARSLIATGVAIMDTNAVKDEVIAKTGVDYTRKELSEMIGAWSSNGSEVLAIQVVSPDAEEAALIANTIAEILVEKIPAEVEESSASILDVALVPEEKEPSGHGKNMVIGGLLGAVAACAVIVVMYLMDDKIHDTDYLTRAYDIPVLAVIPDLPHLGNSGKSGKANAARKAR